MFDTHMTHDQHLAQDVTDARKTLLGIDPALIPTWLSHSVSSAVKGSTYALPSTGAAARKERALRNTEATLEVIRAEAKRNHVGTSTRIQPVVPTDVALNDMTAR